MTADDAGISGRHRAGRHPLIIGRDARSPPSAGPRVGQVGDGILESGKSRSGIAAPDRDGVVPDLRRVAVVMRGRMLGRRWDSSSILIVPRTRNNRRTDRGPVFRPILVRSARSLHRTACPLQGVGGNRGRSRGPEESRIEPGEGPSTIASQIGHQWLQERVRRILSEGSFLRRGCTLYFKCAVEQRLARQAHNLEVVGSIPTGATFDSRSSTDREFFFGPTSSAAAHLPRSGALKDGQRLDRRVRRPARPALLRLPGGHPHDRLPSMSRDQSPRPLPNSRTRRAWPIPLRMRTRR